MHGWWVAEKGSQIQWLRASSAVPQYLPCPHKTIILGTAILFSCSNRSPIPFFFVVTNISLISSQRKGEIQLHQYHGDNPNYHFSAIFSLALLWDLPFIWVLEEIYWGTAAVTPPINLESDIGLPQYHLIGEVVLGDCWRCSDLLSTYPSKAIYQPLRHRSLFTNSTLSQKVVTRTVTDPLNNIRPTWTIMNHMNSATIYQRHPLTN